MKREGGGNFSSCLGEIFIVENLMQGAYVGDIIPSTSIFAFPFSKALPNKALECIFCIRFIFPSDPCHGSIR